MTAQELAGTAHKLVGSGKGLLAMDESNGTCDKRFAAADIPPTEEGGGQDSNVAAAQDALAHRAGCDLAALHGEYTKAMELA